MALFASGNQLIWIRPSFQDNQIHNYNAWHFDPKTHKKLGAVQWGDETNLPDPKTWFSMAVDRGQSYWIVRHNPGACRSFMFALTGAAKMSGPDLHIFGRQSGADPFLIMMNYQYALEAAVRKFGNAINGPIYDSSYELGRTETPLTGYRQRTRFVRQLDSSMMTPDERLCEMTQCAIEDPEFSRQMKAQFGMLGDPVVLFQLAMVIGVFVGIGAGATFLGGAAFAAALMRLAGFAMITHQLGGYVQRFNDLKECVFSEKQQDFVRGVQTVQQLLVMAVTDIAMILFGEALIKVGVKAITKLKDLVLKYAPEDWAKAAKEFGGHVQHKVAIVQARRFGYAGEQLLKQANKASHLFRKSELDYFLKRAARDKEMIVIRGPSADRIEWLTKLKGWLDGKPEWIKAKSWMGWKVGGRDTGLIAVPKDALNQALTKAGIKLQQASPYPIGNLKGVFEEIDEYVAQLSGKTPTSKGQQYSATRPSFEIPIGADPEVIVPGKGKMHLFDWKAARHKGADAQGCRLVDMGDSYLVVDSLGRPICQDLDIGAIQRMGTPSGEITGSHLPSGRVNPEDNFIAEHMANWEMSNGDMYSPIKHSGGGGSGRHIGETNSKNVGLEGKALMNEAAGQHASAYYARRKIKNPWRPRNSDGNYAHEDLYVFLPVKGGGSQVFHVDGWGELEKFWEANQQLFGSKWVF